MAEKEPKTGVPIDKIQILFIAVLILPTFLWFETASSNPGIPSNVAFNIGGMDDSDNLYAQRKWYTYSYSGFHPDGYEQIKFVQVSIRKTGYPFDIDFRYYYPNGTFTVFKGNNFAELDVNNCVASAQGTNLDLTFKFKVKWGALNADGYFILAYIKDVNNKTDVDAKNNYCDLITNLLTSFKLNATSGPANASLLASGNISYSTTWGGRIQSSFYPPDNEFNNVSIYTYLNHTIDINKGTSSVENGTWSIQFTGPESDSETYCLFIDMADADYKDGVPARADYGAVMTPTETYNVISDDPDPNPGFHIPENPYGTLGVLISLITALLIIASRSRNRNQSKIPANLHSSSKVHKTTT